MSDKDISGPQELQVWLLQQHDALMLCQAEIIRDSLTDLSHAFLYERKVRVEQNDVGYDCSDSPQKTNLPYRAEDYETVADFLAEATGERVATFVSGAGLAAETYEDQVYEQLNSRFFELFKTMTAEHLCLTAEEDLPYELEDLVAEAALEWTWETLASIQAVSLSWMLKAHQASAEDLESSLAADRAQKAEQQRSDQEIARRVHLQARFLLTKPKYTMEEKDELIIALEQLSQLVSAKELAIYLQSYLFGKISSNRLQQVVCGQFTIAPYQDA